jgi:hypothetical protein
MTEQFKKVVEHVHLNFQPSTQEDFIHLLVDILEYISIFISEGETFEDAFDNAFEAVKEDLEQQLNYEPFPLSLNAESLNFDVTLSSIDVQYHHLKHRLFDHAPEELTSKMNWNLN